MKKIEYSPRKDYKERYDLIRHPERIRSSDVIEGVFTNITYFDSPDPSLIAAKGFVEGIECFIMGQEKRRKGKESKATGMLTAKGFSFTLQILELAEKTSTPVISFIDTFGGDTSMESELIGQSFLISDCISKYCSVITPTISFVIGEGGSGGALALQVADKAFMLENALYSVIAPESCSRIIFHKRLAAGETVEETLSDALDVLRPGADHLKEIGMIDEILPEPKIGAHINYEFTIGIIKENLIKTLNEWEKGNKSPFKKIAPKLQEARRKKVLNYGTFIEDLDKLLKRKTKREIPFNIPRVDVEREDFHTLHLMQAHLDIEEIGDLVKCEKEWNADLGKFKVAGGCGFISFKDYQDNFYACPKCGKGENLKVQDQIEKICDKNTFHEIEGDLTIRKMIERDRYFFGSYQKTLEKIEAKCFSKEGLVTGKGKLESKDVVFAITDLSFFGGSFGAAFGEKFCRAINYSIKHNIPFISVCSSGGARMNEGPMSLAQMAKMNMAILDLKKAGILYISVIIGPTTGGAYASYVTQGDIIIGEKGGLVEFAGPRVVTGAGFEVDPEIVITDSLYKTGKIHDLVTRKGMKKRLAHYVNIFYDLKCPECRNTTGRIHDFRKPIEVKEMPTMTVVKD
jgi:acetyl-CoA carboxylase carboxyl transferase beta subunit